MLRFREREQYLAEIDKLINSQVLHGSESLCKLLRYLAEHALDHPGSSLKEYQIATEVFGRPHDFDPQHDSTIRVQAGRLRLKLAEYYATEGAEDTLSRSKCRRARTWFRSTAGSRLRRRQPHLATSRDLSQKNLTERRSGATRDGRWPPSSCRACLIVAAGDDRLLLATYRRTQRATERVGTGSRGAFATFWKAFVTGPEEPWVIFSNGAFVGRPRPECAISTPAAIRAIRSCEHYTGVGEVLAIHALDHTFGLLHRQLRVKRGSLLSLDDVKNNDMIFVGSPAENLTLREIPSTAGFCFSQARFGTAQGRPGGRERPPPTQERPQYWIGSPSHSASERRLFSRSRWCAA